jgi:hypothetical protein
MDRPKNSYNTYSETPASSRKIQIAMDERKTDCGEFNDKKKRNTCLKD